MDEFGQQLLRLKQCLGVTADQYVAAALGMSRTAFAERKRRGAFPEDKLFALKATTPDLDVMYVLTGEKWAPNERRFEDFMAARAGARDDPEFTRSVARSIENSAQMIQAAVSYPPVRRLIGLLVFCDDATIDVLARQAFRLRLPEPLPFDQRAAGLSTTSTKVEKKARGSKLNTVAKSSGAPAVGQQDQPTRKPPAKKARAGGSR